MTVYYSFFTKSFVGDCDILGPMQSVEIIADNSDIWFLEEVTVITRNNLGPVNGTDSVMNFSVSVYKWLGNVNRSHGQ